MNKKRTLFLITVLLYIFCVVFSQTAKAQNIGINTTGATPNASAGLDVDFSNKGFLIPRVALTSTSSAGPITSPATSLMVYNTATAGTGATAVAPGFYYWTGSAWVQVATNGGTAGIWSRTGSNVFLTNAGDLVGLGTSTPYEKLHISNGNMVLDNTYHMKNSTGKNIIGPGSYSIEIGDMAGFPIDVFVSNDLNFFTPSSSGLGIYKSNGYFGLGTNSPGERLTLASGNMQMDNGYHIKNNIGKNIIGPGTYSIEIGEMTGYPIDVFVSNDLNFITPSSSGLGIYTSNGFFGLGTNSPSERLTLASGNMQMDNGYHIKNNTGKNIIGPGTYSIEIGDLSGYPIDMYVNNDLNFLTSSSSGVGIYKSNGYLGLGTTSPSERLEIQGNFKLTGAIMPNGLPGTAGQVLTSAGAGLPPTWTTIASSSGWNLTGNSGTTAGTNFLGTTDAKDLVIKTTNLERVRVLADGNVGIGTSTPVCKLDVADLAVPSGARRFGIYSRIFSGPAGSVDTVIGAKTFALNTNNTFNSLAIGAEGTAAPSTNGFGIGLLGVSTTGSNSVGIMGSAKNNGTGTVYGGQFTALPLGSGTAYGSYNQVNGVGTTLYGSYNRILATSSATTSYGVYALSNASATTNYGINANATSSGTNYGGSFSATTSSGGVVNYGVYATATGAPVNWAGYFVGDQYVSGNMGIGTTGPAFKLDVTGTGRFTSTLRVGAYTLPATDGTSGQVLKTNGAGVLTWQADAGGPFTGWGLTGNASTTAGTNYIGTSDAIDLVTKTNAVERMRVLSTGEIGVGITAPTRQFSVGNASSNISLWTTGTNPYVETNRGVNYAPRLNMGPGFGETYYEISNNSFTTTLSEYIFGTSQSSNSFRSGTDNTKSLGSAGLRWTTVYATNGTINTSDRREKENIKSLNYGLAEVMKLKPVTFTWIGDEKQRTKIGLIAQEIQPVIKEVVYNPKDDQPEFVKNEKGEMVKNPNYIDRYGVYYSDLIPVLIKAIQEQEAKITALENKITKLENK